MKKLITLICTMMFVCCPALAYEYDSETVDVFITVTDITDVNNPFNVLVPRTEITVSNCDITKYGEQFAGVELLDSGVTYLHALLKLHENLYGVDGVGDYFKMDADKVTRVFMGKSVANVMYKSLTYTAQTRNGGILVGTSSPVILTSRADSFETKVNSIALAALVSQGRK